MPSHIDLQGASGALYRFRSAEDPRARTPMSGAYAYVRVEGDTCGLVFLADADNLMMDSQSRWTEAQSAHGATDIFVRLNVAQSVRRAELEDLLKAGLPPMNQADAAR